MKHKYLIFIVVLMIFSSCTNNKVNPIYKEKQYSIIKGLNASQEGKYSVAIGHFLNAYAIDPKEPYTLRELALNYGQSGDYKNAEKFYLEFLEIMPNDSNVTYNLGIIYYNQKRYAESIDLLSKISAENNTIDIISLKAYNYYGLGNFNETYTILKDLVELKKNDIYFTKIYADVLLKTGRIGELHPFITKVYKENLNNPEIIYIYGKHLNDNLGRSKDAIDTFERYIIDYGVNREINLEAARVTLEENKPEEAKKYLELLPEKLKYEEEYLNLSLKVYEKLHDTDKVKEINTVLKKIVREW